MTTRDVYKGRVTKLGTSIFKGGAGKNSTVLIDGKQYWLYKALFDAPELDKALEQLRSDGYEIRLTKATFDGTVLNVYTNPEVTRVPHAKY